MWPGSSSSRGEHFGSGNHGDRGGAKRPGPDYDPERAARVASDAGRKRDARRYTNWGQAPPRAYARREVEEYDRKMAAAAARGGGASGSSSSTGGAGSSAMARAPLPPPKREEEEQGLAPTPVHPGFLPGDYVDDGDIDVLAEIMEHTKDDEQKLKVRRELEEELDEFHLCQAIERSHADRPWGASDSDFD